VIADFDGDGDNELFAGGGSPYSGSTFLWEATGSGTGYVSWLDTTSMSSFIVHRSSFGVVDSSPSVISIGASIYTEQMFLRSDSLLNVAYYDPIFSDIDQDDKMNILIVDIENNTVVDWEQTSAGLWEKPIPSIPQEFLLHPNYPNPFNNMTIIRFQLPVAGFIRLDIFDINGRNVGAVREPPLQGHWYSAGTHQITFDGSNLSSGIYIYRLQAGDLTASGKMILMK